MNRVRKALIGAGLVATTLTGGAIGAAMVNGSASAQTDTSTTAPAQSQTPSQTPGNDAGRAFDPAKGGHVGANGVKEELLTGDTADEVTSAAQAAVADGTIERVETDAEGAAYEAHMVKADGSHVTVKLDSSFNVTSVEDGPGR